MQSKVLRRIIILCWIILSACFIIKLLGGNFFGIFINNKTYTKVCSYVDHHMWCKFIIGSISTTLLNTLFLLAINHKLKFTKVETIVVILSSIITAVLKVLNLPVVLNALLDIYQFVGLPLIIKSECLIEHKIRYIIFGNILVPIFQILSLVTRNIGLKTFVTNDYLTASILIIDVYIMCTLYYLYANIKTGGKHMGWWLDWLWGKSDSQLKAMKDKRVAQVTKLQEKPTEAKQKKIDKLQAEIVVLANEITRREQANANKN